MDRSYVQSSQEDGKENPEAWRSQREKRNERKLQMGLNSRCLSTLQYMVERPHVRTSAEIVGAKDPTMEQLPEKGALTEGPRDSQGDRTWTVTDAGGEEISRNNDWPEASGARLLRPSATLEIDDQAKIAEFLFRRRTHEAPAPGCRRAELRTGQASRCISIEAGSMKVTRE
ncbi:hypothetical protein [Pararhizobium sp. PWRC1-1]|uniref:hypothetical protein n=1 Tax=Pararhizobium sp. PWRC1-1 TaxID=2804566 RepID=UPI003CF3D8FC